MAGIEPGAASVSAAADIANCAAEEQRRIIALLAGVVVRDPVAVVRTPDGPSGRSSGYARYTPWGGRPANNGLGLTHGRSVHYCLINITEH